MVPLIVLHGIIKNQSLDNWNLRNEVYSLLLGVSCLCHVYSKYWTYLLI